MLIAVVGATGLVGRKMLQVLQEHGVDQRAEIIAVASPRSVGKRLEVMGRTYVVVSVDDAIARRPHYALFSAGGSASLQYAPRFADAGTVVIDNSSAWRMHPDVPLVIPEINIEAAKMHHNIIANPNCSTIQMLMALAPLHRQWRLRRIVVSTYQSVSGSGQKGLLQLDREEAAAGSLLGDDLLATSPYQHPIHRNVLPHAGTFDGNDYTTEEDKLVRETHKIFDDSTIGVSATAARVPVVGGHSESVNAEFCDRCSAAEARELLDAFPGVRVVDDPNGNIYPMPIDAHEHDEVLVGRIRDDHSQPNTLNLWVVADNLRKGAATNAVQILEALCGLASHQ